MCCCQHQPACKVLPGQYQTDQSQILSHSMQCAAHRSVMRLPPQKGWSVAVLFAALQPMPASKHAHKANAANAANFPSPSSHEKVETRGDGSSRLLYISQGNIVRVSVRSGVHAVHDKRIWLPCMPGLYQLKRQCKFSPRSQKFASRRRSIDHRISDTVHKSGKVDLLMS